MLKKLKAIIDHPYAAPLTQAVKTVGSIALFPLEGFIEAIGDAFEDNNYDDDAPPKLLRMYGELLGASEGTSMMTLGGMVLAGIGGAITAGVMVGSGGAGVLGIVGACAAALSVGVAAGPFLLAGVVATVAATVGCVIGGVPGFIKGCGMAIDHIKNGKAQAAVAAALPPGKSQDEELTASLAKALAAFRDLPKDQRATYVKMMNEQHAEDAWNMNDKLLQAFDSLNDRDRSALVKGLSERLKTEFTELAKREANDSTVLQKEIQVDGPIKLKVKKPAA